MTVRVYATVADYQTWSGDVITPAPRVSFLLARASEHIDRALVGAVYTIDPNGYPTDAMLLDVVNRAVCAQVAFLIDYDDDHGAKQRFQSVMVGNVSFQRAAGTAGNAQIPIGPNALDILRNSGALPTAPMINW